MRIWISLATFNRKTITEIVLKQLAANKQDSFLHVSNDYSTDYDDQFLLSHGANSVEKPSEKLGIHFLRCWELEQFLKTDYDLCYLTDNDAYHDPIYVTKLKEIYDRYKLPTSLYNTRWHFNSTIRQDGDVIFRRTLPGISQLYDRTMVEKILKGLKAFGRPNYAWDYRFIEFLQCQTVTTAFSYIEHFGIGGIHNQSMSDFERDRAYNPTMFLQQTRQPIINQLTQINSNTFIV